MGNPRFSLAALGAAALLLGSSSANAQDISIYGGAYVVVADAFDQASVYNGTYFQNVSVGQEKEFTLWVTSEDSDTNIVLDGPVTLSGAHPGDFTVYFPYDNLFNASFPLLIKFKPTVAGPRSAIVTINSNAPGSEASYSFSIGGVGVVGSVPPTFDVLMAGPDTGIKSTTNKKGETKVRWKLKAYNWGPVPTEGGLVAFYHSDDGKLSFVDDVFIGEKEVKALPAFVEGKKEPRRKVTFKKTFDQEGGYIFAVISGYPVTPIENDITNNVIRSGY